MGHSVAEMCEYFDSCHGTSVPILCFMYCIRRSGEVNAANYFVVKDGVETWRDSLVKERAF